jgi:prevent-host-death family protein
MILLTTIRPSVDLRNNYNEISKICNEYQEPVFITKNGRGDLAVMSMDLYNRLTGRQELYRLIDEGIEAAKTGNVKPYGEFKADIRKRIETNEI